MLKLSSVLQLVFADAQGAGGTSLGALQAVQAVLDGVALLELRPNDRGEAAAHQTQQALAHHFVADADALVAEDTLALVPLDGDQALLLEAGVDLAAAVAPQAGDILRLKLIQVGAADELTLGEVEAAAVQATGGLGAGLGLGEAEVDLLEVVLALLRITGGLHSKQIKSPETPPV